MEWLICILGLCYGLSVLSLYLSWSRIATNEKESQTFPRVSIVVAFRNEEQYLPLLLRSLVAQDYPKDWMEIILVNDHSEDDFTRVFSASSFSMLKVQMVHLPEGVYGKKNALSAGLKKAQADWILTTDADCVMGNRWVRTMINHAEEHGARFVFGPVMYKQEAHFLSRFQAIELGSLIGSGAALWHMGYPTMCNGANLLYKKELVSGKDVYSENEHLASGDDEFLMHQIYQACREDVSFVKNREAVVETAACSSWSSFYQQRKRWASKWGAYQLGHVKWIAFGVFLLNMGYALLPLLVFFNGRLIPWILIVYLIRWILDGIFLKEIICFYEKPFNLVSYVGVALIYPYYVVVSALSGRWGKYEWKGRTVS